MNALTTAPAEHWALPGLAAKINAETAAVERDFSSAVGHALAAGRLLAEAKKAVAHGEWLPWLQANVTIAPRTAQAYVRLAQHYDRQPEQIRNSVAYLPLREAVRAMSTPASAPPSQPPIRARDRGQCARAAEALRKCSVATRESAKLIELMQGDHGHTILSGSKVAALRKKLSDAMQAVVDMLVEDAGDQA